MDNKDRRKDVVCIPSRLIDEIKDLKLLVTYVAIAYLQSKNPDAECCPRVLDIAKVLGLDTVLGVERWIQQLEDAGFLKIKPRYVDMKTGEIYREQGKGKWLRPRNAYELSDLTP